MPSISEIFCKGLKMLDQEADIIKCHPMDRVICANT